MVTRKQKSVASAAPIAAPSHAAAAAGTIPITPRLPAIIGAIRGRRLEHAAATYIILFNTIWSGSIQRVVIKPNAYYVLLSLSHGPRHGLAIARDVLRFSGEQTRLWPATLYGTLQDLADRGWIEEIDPADEKRRPDASERKRYYGLTRSGLAALNAETERLSDLVRVARRASRKGPA